MGIYGRFKFDGYTPEYPSEEAMLTDYLNKLRDAVPTEVYRDIFSSLLRNDKKTLADILTKVCTRVNEQQKRLNEQQERLKHTKELEKKMDQLWQENYELRQQLDAAYKSSAGRDLRIRDLYAEEKKSLREIADIVGMDKNTVKRHLEKMGVYNDIDANAKLLAQHIKI